MPDKYDKAVKFLTKHPELIQDAWGYAMQDQRAFDPVLPSSCLFMIAGNCGCLTQVRARNSAARDSNDKLMKEIRADKRIPTKRENITVEHLPVFAEWQRRLDKEVTKGKALELLP